MAEREHRKFLPSRSTVLLLPILLTLGISAMIVRPILPGLIREFFRSPTTNSSVPLFTTAPFSNALLSSSSSSVLSAVPSCEDDGYSQAASVSSTVDSLSAAASFAVSALIGGLSDSFGRKPMLAWAIALSMLSPLCLLVTENLWFYFVARGLQGFGGTTNILASSVLLSCCADFDIEREHQLQQQQQQQQQQELPTTPTTLIVIKPQEQKYISRRTTDMAWLTATTGFVLVISPLFAMLGSKYLSNFVIFLTSFILGGISFFYVIFILPESLPRHRRKQFSFSSLNPLSPLKLLRQRPTLAVLCLVYFLSSLPESGVVEIALLYCDDVLGLTGSEATTFNATLYIICGVCLLFTLTIGFHGMLKFVSEHTLMVFGFLLNAAHMAGYALTNVFPYKATMYATEVAVAFSGPGNVALNSMASKTLLPSEVGMGMGCLSAIGGMNGAFGPLIFGWLYSTARCAPINFPEAPFYLGVAMGLASTFVTIIWVPRAGPKQPDKSEACEPLLSPAYDALLSPSAYETRDSF